VTASPSSPTSPSETPSGRRTAPVFRTSARPLSAERASGKAPRGQQDGFAACLRDKGVDGAPDGAALKPWLGRRLERRDAATLRALEECAPEPAKAKAGPFEKELRSCLKDHGIEVPGDDARALKRWLLEHGDDAAYRDALKACDIAPVTKPAGAGACDKKGAVAIAVPAGRAKEVTIFESPGTAVNRGRDQD
jgi:hypothetical protein